MSSAIQNEYIPDQVSPPGSTLEETLEALGMTQAQLAERMGRPKKTVNEIIQGKAALTPETALQLERVLGVPARFWNNRERHYREYLARLEEDQQLALHTGWLREFPVAAMAKLGWIARHSNPIQQLRELLTFFGVVSPDQWQEVWCSPGVAFRRSPAFESRPGAVAAWLRKGELEARAVVCADYDVGTFRDALGKVRALTAMEPTQGMASAVGICAAAGVAVVLIPELPGTRVCGATRWLTPGKALLQLSFRYKTDDHLWFSFFHEAAHIIRQRKRDVVIEDGTSKDNEEKAADEFARNQLMPSADYAEFVRAGRFSKIEIARFASKLGIAPGIVVGRLQHDGKLRPDYCNGLKRRVEFQNKV